MEHHLSIGSKAPDFSLPDQEGRVHSLHGYRGKWVLLYFYPEDDTSGCTKEACMIRDNLPEFEKLDCQVLGVSIDSIDSHDKFAKKYSLNFTILSDQQKEVVNLYGAWRGDGTQRMSYLINPDGTIVKIYPDVKPESHASEVLEDLKSFNQ